MYTFCTGLCTCTQPTNQPLPVLLLLHQLATLSNFELRIPAAVYREVTGFLRTDSHEQQLSQLVIRLLIIGAMHFS